MNPKKLNELIKKSIEKDMINAISYKQFTEYINIKNDYNQAFNTSLFFDIKKKFKKEFKLFLIGLFHDDLDLKCYLLHKDYKKRDKIEILSSCDHITALKIKKRYFSIFNRNLLDEFKNDILKYMSYLLSDYFLPEIDKDNYTKITDQLFNMDKNNTCDENFVFYCFQLPNNILLDLCEIYKKKYGCDIQKFINKFFKGEIKTILEKRIAIISHSDYLSSQIKHAINNKDSWELTKILILNKSLDIEEYDINPNILNENIRILYCNIIEFNYYKIYISDIIKHMKITHSIPFIFIFNIDKIFFNDYIKTYQGKMKTSYSDWADYLENDLKKLDQFIHNLAKKRYININFKFKMTFSIAFIIKFLFEYLNLVFEQLNLIEDLDKYIDYHNKIIKNNPKLVNEESCFNFFFTSEKKTQIYNIFHYIIELSIPFFDQEKQIIFMKKNYLSPGNNKIGNEIRKYLENIMNCEFFPFKKCDFETILKMDKIIDNFSNSNENPFIKRKGFKEYLKSYWKITKKDIFCITYKNISVDYMANSYIK